MMARLLAVASVALYAAAVLAQAPAASVAQTNVQVLPHVRSVEASAFELPENYLDLIRSDDVPQTACQPLIQDHLQPVLNWYRDLNLMPLNPSEKTTPKELLRMLRRLTNALQTRDSAATDFVTTMRARAACQLVEFVMLHHGLPYFAKVVLLKALLSINPDAFSVNIDQIPPGALAQVRACLPQQYEDPNLYSRPMSQQDLRTILEVYPQPFGELLLTRKQIERRLKALPVDTLIKAIPLLARLGIRMELTEILVQKADVNVLIELYPFLSTKAFWFDLGKWLSSVGHPAGDARVGLSPMISLLRLSAIILPLLSIPEFVHDVEIHSHSKTFARFVAFLQYHALPVYLKMLLHNVTKREIFASVMASGRQLYSEYSRSGPY